VQSLYRLGKRRVETRDIGILGDEKCIVVYRQSDEKME